MCKVKNCANSIEVAENRGSNIAQNSIIEQHTIEVLEYIYTHTFSYIIKIEINRIVAFSERISTL